ncbi:MAG: hypothetical protein M1376_09750 [Planctomycetes bacterium]|nr:hypothetical protein [Planctomycetota bacterium]
MAERMDNWALNDGQKTRLLSLALERDSSAAAPNEDEQKGDLLRNILRCALPLEASASSAAAVAGPSSSGPRTVAGPPLGELLRDRATDLAVLKQIKEYTKALGRNAKSGIERDVFAAVYFAAIAAARVFHNEHVTEHTDERLVRFLHAFAQAAWMPADLAGLFFQAAKHRLPEMPPAGPSQE